MYKLFPRQRDPAGELCDCYVDTLGYKYGRLLSGCWGFEIEIFDLDFDVGGGGAGLLFLFGEGGGLGFSAAGALGIDAELALVGYGQSPGR